MEIIGRQLEVGYGVEKVRGTAQLTAEKWVKNVSANIVEKAEHAIDDSSFNRLEDSENRRIVRKWIEGNLEGIVHADAIGYIFYNLYGGVTSALVTSGVYTHTFALTQAIQHASLTLFVKEGAVQQMSFKNGMVSTLELNASVNDFVRYTAGFMAVEAGSNSSTPSYGTEYDFISRDITIKVADTEAGLSSATALKIKDISITFDAGLIPDQLLGNYYADDIYNAKLSIEGSFTKNFDDTTFKDLYLTDTAKYISITIQGAADLGSGNNPTITLLMNKAKIMNWDRSGANDELVTETVDFKAFYNATDTEASTLVIKNKTAEYATPISD